MAQPDDRGPATVRRTAPLTRRERRTVFVAGVVPPVASLVVLVPLAAVTGATAAEVIVAALVYGGLLGLAAAFVRINQLQVRQCPRCRARGERGAVACEGCGYDLIARPRYRCTEGCAIHLEEGMCACGRRLHELPTARGVGREVVSVLKLGAWLLVFLFAVGIALQLLDRTL